VAAGLLASACCLGPLLLGALGLGGAGLLAGLDPYRPLFTVVTFGLLGAGFWLAYRKRTAAEGEACGCERPRARRMGRAVLWLAALVAVGLWGYPFLAGRLFS
jgi:mercuric ion transport protein